MNALSDQLLMSSAIPGHFQGCELSLSPMKTLANSTKYTNGFYIAYNEIKTNFFCVSLFGLPSQMIKTGWA